MWYLQCVALPWLCEKEVIYIGYRQFAVGAPPTWWPGESREHYLPEYFHFALATRHLTEQTERAARDEFLSRAMRATARYVSRWADSYLAFPLTGRAMLPDDVVRQGTLPESLEERDAIIDSLFAWFETHQVPLYVAALVLSRNGIPLLEQHDGMPGVLALSPEEFAELQAEWERQGLPRDLYYPAHEQQTVVEPTELFGGVVLQTQHYSPRAWALRQENALALPEIPSERECLRQFLAAGETFMQALLLRWKQLYEPGRVARAADVAEWERVRGLIKDVRQALRFAHMVLVDIEATGTEDSDVHSDSADLGKEQ